MKHVVGKSSMDSPWANLITFHTKVTCSVDVGQAVDIVYLQGFLQGFRYGFSQPSPRETGVLHSRQVVYAVGGNWLTRCW